MKLRGDIKINGRSYKAGEEVPWYSVYPFFLFHMLAFGGSGFVMAYVKDGPPVGFLYAHGGLAILVYTLFYINFFGWDEVKWMFINAGLGVLAIYAQVGWVLSLFGREIGDYPLYVHVVPFLYYVLYSYLLRQALLDMLGARDDEAKMALADRAYIGLNAGLSLAAWLL